MSSKPQTPKEKYDALLKEIRIQKSLPVLEKIYDDLKQNKEHLYDDLIIPFQFSNDFIWFLKYNLISIQTQMDIFKLYIEEFFSLRCKPENIPKIQFLYEIFNYDSNFYSKASNIDNFLVFLNRFFNLYYPKNIIEHKEGDYMDILINEERDKVTLPGWVQLKIKRVDKEKNLYIFEDYKDIKKEKEIMIAMDNFKVQERNTYIKEEEVTWRKNLKIGDKVDFLNSNHNWVEATIHEVISEIEISIKPIDQTAPIYDNINRFSPFIQPLLKYSFKFGEEDLNAMVLLEPNDDFHRFNYFLPVTEQNHLVPHEDIKFYSLEYYDIMNFFINKIIESSIFNNESLGIDYIYAILNILYSASYLINKKFLGEYFENNCYEKVKNILLKFSLDKKVNKQKFVLENIIIYIDRFLGFIYYPFQLCKFLPEFIIEFGYNCFKYSESLEKRLLGLNSILKILPILNKFFPIISSEAVSKITALISEKLLGSGGKEDLFGLLFIDPNIHEQLLFKGVEIITFLTKLKFLDDKDIERLYNFALSAAPDSDIFKALYDLLNKLTYDIELSQEKILFDKIISFPYDKIRENDIFLMLNVLQNIKSENDFKNMTKIFLDYYYDYIVIFKNKEEASGPKFAQILSYAKDDETLKYLYVYYFDKIVDDLNSQNDLVGYRFFFTLIYNLVDSLEKRAERDQRSLPFLKMKFREIFLKINKNMEIISDKIMDINAKDNSEFKDEEKNESYISDIISIVDRFISFIEEKNFFTVESMKKLCEYFIFSDVLHRNRNTLLVKIDKIDKDVFDKERFLEYFFNRFDKFLDTINEENPERYKLLDNFLVFKIFNYYNYINTPIEEVINTVKDSDIEYYKKNCYQYKSKINPLNTKYFDIVWKMYIKLNNVSEVKKFLEVFSLKNFSPEERHEIWEKLIKKIFNEINNNILLSLKMIEFIIITSEKYGHGGAKSHFLDSKKKIPVKLIFKNELTQESDKINFSDEEKFYSTDTIYDIKKKIQNKYGIDPIFMDIGTNKSSVYSSSRNPDWKSLVEIFPKIQQNEKEDYILTIRRSDIYSSCPMHPLLDEEGMSPTFQKVFLNIFNKYTKEEKLDYNNFKKYFKTLFHKDRPDDVIEKQSKEAFNKLDPMQRGYITFQDFLLFQENEKNKGYSTGVFNQGYAPTLDYILAPLNPESPLYYKENDVKEYMPRYFIGNNKEYMGKLFTFAKYENKIILETAQNLLQDVCTMEEMKKTIFEKSNKIEEIISNPNLELRGYAFQILLTEFEKDGKDENSLNLVDNFIKNNLKKVIEELVTFSNSNEEIKEDKDKENCKIVRYFNFYLTNLKIIFYCFKNIIGNDDVINYIDKFDDLEDENEKNVFKNINTELSKEKQNIIKYLHLDDLINILGNNLLIINEKTNQIFRQGIHLTLKLLIYTVLLSKDLPEKDKTEIYKSYTIYEINLIQKSSFYIKRLFYTANKLLLNIMNFESDKKYILVKYDELAKEMLNYEKLNNFEGKLIIFFKIFIDLLEISIKGTQNEKIFSLYGDLMKLILDKNIELKEYLLSGYLNIVKEILSILRREKWEKLYQYDFESLINKIISEFIITFDKDENDKINEIKNLKNYSRYSESDYVSYIFQIITIIISLNPEKYLQLFFLNEDIKNVREKHLTKLEESTTGYDPYTNSRSSSSHIGLKNLSSICYMNSVLQQFFMIPLFRYSILSLPIPPELKVEKEDNDDLLYQLIRMFYYLNYSDKGDYNPKNFVFSFKDYDGNPTKINIQCDAQEFLSRFVEKVEETLKCNDKKFLLSNILGGTTLQQVKCTNPECGNVSERRENINFLSLDIKNVKSVEECLNKFILEEKIEDYLCEKCKKKITNIKNVVIDKIPNFLIIHLQRFAFSYETFNMEKMNSYITFEKELNIKKYTIDKNNENIPLEYFDYDLQGVLIHSGTAQYGHYYSFIANENKDKEKDKTDIWFKFNDSKVTKVNYDNITSDAFGNNSQHQYGSSAYMLIYQKTVKKPVIINSKKIDDNSNLNKILEEKKSDNIDKIEIDKDKIYYIYENEKEAVEKNTNVNMLKDEEESINKNIIIKNGSIEANLVSYKEALYSLIKENNEEKQKKPFVKNILLENVKICNDKKFYTKSFSKFIKEEVELIKDQIYKDNTGKKINEYIPVLKAINDYILFIIPFSNNLDHSFMIILDMISIYSYSIPKEYISYLIKDIIEPNKDNFYNNYFTSRDNKKGNTISTYIGNILALGINNNIETELVTKIIQFYLDKIPIEITKKWLDMEAFNNLILTLVENSNIIKKSFINNSIIAKLIDLIMGRESPLFQGDERIENKNNKPKYGNIVKAIALLYKYYAENFQKEELKLSKSDLLMINCTKFYEKVVLDDYDNDASNMLLDYRMNLVMILNKEENKEDFDKEIIDILINLKIPSITKKDEIISGLNLITHIIEKYAEVYDINKIEKEENKNKFIEKLNILLGVPIPTVKSGEGEIKYISGRYQDKYTILSNIYSQKEKNKEAFDLVKALFNLFNINKIVFDYIDKLPSPNSFKYSFIDYCIKLYSFVIKDTEKDSKAMDEIEMNNPYKEFESLVNEICSKNNKDINKIKNDDKINLDNVIYFTEFNYQYINNVKYPDKVDSFQIKLNYITTKNMNVNKTNLACFTNINYFSNLNGKQVDDNIKIIEENEIHSVLCVIIHCLQDLDISINLKPYFVSKMDINAKKDCHYFIYSIDIDSKIQKEEEKIFQILEFNNMEIKAEERKLLALPQGNKSAGTDDGCAMNCPVCGTVNILNEGNQEFKCIFCESPLF